MADPLPDPPLYKPGEDGDALDRLVDWKVEWLKLKIKAREQRIRGNKRLIKNDPEVDREALTRENSELAEANTIDEDAVKALKDKKAFDPKGTGAAANVKLLKGNIAAALELFDARFKDKDEGPANAKAATRMRTDLEKAEKQNKAVFKK